jgi:hypothetical protein
MTRTDVVASSRPRGAVAVGGGRARGRVARVLSGLSLALILVAALVAPTSALAASEGLSGYSTTTTTTTTKTTPPTTTTTPTNGTSPSKETSEPTSTSSSGVAASTETTTTSSGKSSKSSTLPFTGFDLRWSLAIGFALIAAGCSLILMQRRGRRGTGR